MADTSNNSSSESSSGGGMSGQGIGAIISAVGSVTIGALTAASGNKRAWAALNEKAKLAEQAAAFSEDLQITQNYQDYYIQLQESQQAKQKVTMYTNFAGYMVIGLGGLAAIYLLKKFI